MGVGSKPTGTSTDMGMGFPLVVRRRQPGHFDIGTGLDEQLAPAKILVEQSGCP